MGKFDLKFLIHDPEAYWAHTHELHKEELLEEHMGLTMDYYKKLCTLNKLDQVVARLIDAIQIQEEKPKKIFLSEEIKRYLKNMFEDMIYMHDIGKVRNSFQALKLSNKAFNTPELILDTEHSLLSSLIIADLYLCDIEKKSYTKKEKQLVISILFRFIYIVSRHHGRLDDMQGFQNKLDRLQREVIDYPEQILGYKFTERLININLEKQLYRHSKKRIDNELNPEEMYLLSKLLFSCITACDFYGTGSYMNQKEIEFKNIEDIDKFSAKFEESKIIKNIRKINNDTKNSQTNQPINSLRTKMFLESEKNILNNKDTDIFYLEAPTGSGKTITSINLALTLMKNNLSLNKIFYVFPFNTLSEQTYKVLKEYFDDKDISVINSITPIKISEKEGKYKNADNKEEDYGIDYIKSYLDHLFLHDPIVVTSHVGFFEHLTSINRESAIPIVHLPQSIVILDEIQSYKNILWTEIISMISLYAKYFNVKFIIMSATLPRLSELIPKEYKITELIDNPEFYYQNPLFKDRVKLDFSMLDEEYPDMNQLMQSILQKIQNKKQRVLIEFIRKKDAREFYNLINEHYNNSTGNRPDIFELTGDDNALYRNTVINVINKRDESGLFINKNIILVATQVIEAGVDIDMDVGFKDISLLDSEEQFIGRINRSSMKENALAYFFKYADATKIYNKDIRVEFTLLNPQIQKIFKEKDFHEYYKILLEKIRIVKSQFNKSGIEQFNEAVKMAKFKEINQMLRLIDSENVQIYLPGEIIEEIQENHEDSIIKRVINGKKVWEARIALINDKEMDYEEKQVKLSELTKLLSYFTFSVYKVPKYIEEKFGVFYIENGEEFLDNGKFNREEYEKYSKTLEGNVVL